jgi:hypothetical protein
MSIVGASEYVPNIHPMPVRTQGPPQVPLQLYPKHTTKPCEMQARHGGLRPEKRDDQSLKEMV